MSIVVTNNYTDSAIAGYSEQTLTIAPLNFGADFVKQSDVGGQAILINKTSPLGVEEKVRLSVTEIANIYNGTGIDSSVASPTKRGVSLLSQVTNVISVTDDATPDYRIDLPMSAHLVIKIPKSEHVDASDVVSLVERLLATLFDTGVSTTSRLEGLLRGSLVPSDV